MRHAAHRLGYLRQEAQHRSDVDARRPQELDAEGHTQARRHRLEREARALEEHGARERVAVAMQARRRQPNQHVAGTDAPAVDHAPALHHTEGEAGDVVLAAPVEGRQLGGLAADEAAAGEPTAAGDAAHERRAATDVERAGREVVEEEERLGADGEEIVDAHRDEIDANRVVTIEGEGDAQLRADAVRTGDEQRVTVAARNPRQRREAADAGEDLGSARAAGEGRDPPHEALAGVDVDACRGVRRACRHRRG